MRPPSLMSVVVALACLSVVVLWSLTGWVVVRAEQDEREALKALERSLSIAQTGAARIEAMDAELSKARAQLDRAQRQVLSAREQVHELGVQVRALVAQVGDLGAVPVVIEERRSAGQQTTEPAPGKSGEQRRDRGR